MDLIKIGWEDVEWIHVAQGRKGGNEPSETIKGVEFFE
jgi:hypothetical protein